MASPMPVYSPAEMDLFQRMASDPLSDAPYLAYADWLDQPQAAARSGPHWVYGGSAKATEPPGESRRSLAEFIRVNCELESASVIMGTHRYYELEHRRHTLSSELLPLWEERLSHLPLEFLGFERGLAGQICIAPADFADCAEELFALCPWLSRLTLKGPLAPLPPSDYWQRIAVLDISSEFESPWLAEYLQSGAFWRIVGLSTGGQGLESNDLRTLATSPVTAELQQLAIMQEQFDLSLLRELVDHARWTSLRELRIGFCQAIGAEGAALLAQWPVLAQVQELKLYDTAIGPRGATELASSPYLNGLQELSLEENALGDEGASVLLTSPGLSSLKRLDLADNGISDAGLESLLSRPGAARYESLNLRGNQLGDQALEYLAGASQLARCVSLEVGEQVTAAGIRALGRSTTLRNLRQLSLAYNPDIGDEGAAAMAEAFSFDGLEDLFINECGIGPAGVAALVRAPWAAHLARLSLSDNSLGDEGAAAIADSPRLARLACLDLWDCNIGDEGAVALAQSAHLTSLQDLELVFNEELTSRGARAFAAANMPRLITLWLPEAESAAELDERERLLRQQFGPHIDLGETGVKYGADDEQDEFASDSDDEEYEDD